MQRFVLSENIRRFRAQLERTEDQPTRLRLQAMLLAAERDLALLDASQKGAGLRWERPDAAAREQLKTWFRAEFATSPKLAALIDPAPGLEMVDVNATYERSSGFKRDQVVGHSLFSLFPDNPNDPGADGVKNLYASLRATAETGEVQPMSVQRYDTHDDAGVWTARYWRPVNSPLLDNDGRLVFLLHLVEEATGPAGSD